MAHNMAIVKSRVIEKAKQNGVTETGSPEYQDLMANIEGEVQRTLEEEGLIDF